MASGRILYDKSLDSNARVKLLNVLSIAALKDDVILLLHQDRREHIIMNYAFDIDRHPQEEQLPLAQFVSIKIDSRYLLLIVIATSRTIISYVIALTFIISNS